MSFWSDLGDSLTGAGKRDLAALQLQTSLELANQQLELEKAKALSKQTPEALRAKNIRYVAIAIIAVIAILLVMKWMK